MASEQTSGYPVVWKYSGMDAGSLGVLIDRELDTIHFIATGPEGVEGECAMPIRKARELAKAIQEATGPWGRRS